MAWQDKYSNKINSAEEVMKKVIESGQKIFITGNASTPTPLLKPLAERARELTDLKASMILSFGEMPLVEEGMEKHIRVNALFMGQNVRSAVAQGKADFTPVFLSEVPNLYRTDPELRPDVAIIQVSPPDEHGFCSFGCEVGVSKTAAQASKIVIAEVNEQMPRSLGDSFINVNRITHLIPTNRPLPEVSQGTIDPISQKIAENVSNELIHDGDTLQLGIGAIADGVLKSGVNDKRDLGIHSEMFSDGVVKLLEEGIINNDKKSLHPGKIIAGFFFGSKKLYEFVHNNPIFEMHPSDYVNDPFIIARNDNMVAINGAIEVDLTGQVCSDSIGQRFYSGIGGQVDFIRGAARSKNGRPIIALPATAKGGTLSKIVPTLKPGAGVVTSRGDVHYVATEYGIASLYGKPIRDRVKALIGIADPKFQDELTAYAKKHNMI